VRESRIGGDHVRDGTHQKGTCFGVRRIQNQREREIDEC